MLPQAKTPSSETPKYNELHSNLNNYERHQTIISRTWTRSP